MTPPTSPLLSATRPPNELPEMNSPLQKREWSRRDSLEAHAASSTPAKKSDSSQPSTPSLSFSIDDSAETNKSNKEEGGEKSNQNSSFTGSVVDYGSPTPSQRAAAQGDATEGGEEAGNSSFESGNSSYELVINPSSPPQAPVSTSTSPASSSLAGTIFSRRPSGTFSSLLSFPPRTKVVISAPPPTPPVSSSNHEESPTKSSLRGRASSASNPRTLLNRQSSFGSLLSTNTIDKGRRASHDGTRPRSSLSPVLSPIKDDDAGLIGLDEAELLHLNPSASSFKPWGKRPVGKSNKFPPGASHEFIVKNGKNEIGDLTKEARAALLLINLKPIPSMHGPLTLPYARCPSGIDAFLFSADKDEDPWTFTLEGEVRRRPGARGPPRISLPGNARYSQPSYPSTFSHNATTPRNVSAPAVLEGARREAEHATSILAETSKKIDELKKRPSMRAAMASSGGDYDPNLVNQSHDFYYQGGVDFSVYGQGPFARPMSAAAQQQMYNPFVWPGYPGQNSFYLPPNPYQLQPPGQQQQQAPSASPHPSAYSHPDPSNVSFGYGDESSSYYTAGDDEVEEEPQYGGFFFPAIPTPAQQQTLSRRTSAASYGTAVPSNPTGSRRSSLVPLPSLATLIAERRNSAAPAGPRKSSLAPPVQTTRRSSIAPQTRLVRDSPHKESKTTKRSPPPTPPAAASASTGPPPPPIFVPHHSRPGSASSPSKIIHQQQQHQPRPPHPHHSGQYHHHSQPGWQGPRSRRPSNADVASSWRPKAPVTGHSVETTTNTNADPAASTSGPATIQVQPPVVESNATPPRGGESDRGRGGGRGRGRGRGRGKKRGGASVITPAPTQGS